MDNAFAPGQTVGGYEIVDVIESSRAGATYRVRNLVTQRMESLRVIPDVQGDQAKVDRFLREVKILAGLSHPNIVRFHTAVELEGRLVMTYELVEGVTLAQKLELGPMPVEEAVDLMKQLLRALEHAHSHGVIHREITPANVIITSGRQVKLTGFTMAKQAADTHLTQMGAPVGAVEYMSPEQVKGMAVPDARADLYAAGIVFFEMLTGKPPFRSPSQFDVMFAQVQTTPPIPSSVRPGVPPDIDAALMKVLEKEPANRFQSATDFLNALEPAPVPQTPVAVQEPVAVAAPPVDAAEAAATPVVSDTSGTRLLVFGTAVFILTILLFYVLKTIFG